jgi:response regulator of citrate/malate metabolism
MEGKKHLKVLLIEDNEGDVRLIWEILSEIRDSPFYMEIASTLYNGIEAIKKNKPDIILLDLSLPDSSGIYTLNRIRDSAIDVPIVIITGLDDEITAIKALKEGAQDYLVKGRMDSDLLKKSLLYAYERNKLLLELEKKQEELNKNFTQLKWLDGAKSNFMNNISESLITPIIKIKESVSFLQNLKKIKCKPVQKIKLKVIKENIDKIYDIINDLLDVSRIESGNLKLDKNEGDIIEIIKAAIKNNKKTAKKKKINLVLETKIKKLNIIMDGFRLLRAFQILFKNIIGLSDENSEIIIGLEQKNNGYYVFIKFFSKKIKDTDDISDYNLCNTRDLEALIASGIFKAHNWHAEIKRDEKDKGKVFEIKL